MNFRRIVFASVHSLLFIAHAGCSEAGEAGASNAIPSELIGKWQVMAAVGGADVKKSMTYAPYGSGDARLEGRFFSIGSSSISADTPENPACTVSGVTTRRTTPKALIAASLTGEVWVETKAQDGLSSLGMNLLKLPGASKDASINVVQVTCSSGLFGKELGIPGDVQGAWMFLLPSKELAIRWYDETVLMLKRVPADAKPQPSFDCAKASTASEKAICDSLELASLDATIAERYRDSIEIASDPDSRLTTPSDVPKLKQQQRDWLKQRNACGSDAVCLHKSMEDRLKEEYRFEDDQGEAE